MVIDLTSQVKLRNGGRVKLLHVRQSGDYPIEGEACLEWPTVERACWTRNGKFAIGDSDPNPWDLVEVRR